MRSKTLQCSRLRFTDHWSRFLIATAVVVLLFADVVPRIAQTAVPMRIVSIVPALTEMLFTIGAGPQVVGVSSFARFPAEVEGLPRVGALIDPDIERVFFASTRPRTAVRQSAGSA